MAVPEIKTPLPGSKAQAIIDRDAVFVSSSYTRAYPLVTAKGEGSVIEDVDGNRFLDCAAALVTIRMVREQLMANAAVVGAHLLAGVRRLAERHPLIGDVRGRGLMIGIELVRDRETKERADTERDALVMAAFRRGLLTLGAGRNVVRLSPPLVLTQTEADTALELLDEAFTEVEHVRR